MKSMIFITVLVLFIYALVFVFGSIDLKVCKVTHSGTEYRGRVSKTEGGGVCQQWILNKNLGVDLSDDAFPEGSKRQARNYCRNPDGRPDGPWCYTTSADLITDTCSVPICNVTDCRISGTGIEYSGSVKRTLSGKKCADWDDVHYLKKKEKEARFKNKNFPDGTVGSANNRCRNPDGNIAGPWCYVEKDGLHEKELCDIPFCNDTDPIMYSEEGDTGRYVFFTRYNMKDNLNISFILWNPSDWLEGNLYILLSALDVSCDRSQVRKWGSGIEISLGHAGTSILTAEEDTLQKTPHILSGAKWTHLHMAWRQDNTSILFEVFKKGKAKPIAITEIITTDKVLQQAPFQFLAMSGSPAFWNVDAEECAVHTTSKGKPTRFWEMRRTTTGCHVQFFLRGARRGKIMLRGSPVIDVGQVEVVLGDKDKFRVAYYDENKNRVVVKEITYPKIIQLWKWEEFKIDILGDQLQVYWVREASFELVLDVHNKNIRTLNWFGVASSFIAYWTIYCDPRGVWDPPSPTPPECVSKEGDDQYVGTQSITETGFQCIPWLDKDAIPQKYQELYGDAMTILNYCRNLDRDGRGPYCFIADPLAGHGYRLEYCEPRSCNLGECKLAGTGNDYSGRLNETRSGRNCLGWSHRGSQINVRNFPETDIVEAENFCRNPSRSIGGVWCYANDSLIQKESCFVKDCHKPLSCTILISNYKPGRLTYILPTWRKYGLFFWLKSWNPDIYEGLALELISSSGLQSYRIHMGDDGNEKLRFFYINGNETKLLQEKTMPHLIPSGKWNGFWLRPGDGKIEIGHINMVFSFFEWISDDNATTFRPVFLNYGTINENWLGINLKCSECLLEKTSIQGNDRVFPIELWKEQEHQHPSNLIVHFRSSGIAGIRLIEFPGENNFVEILINAGNNTVSVSRSDTLDEITLLATVTTNYSILNEEEFSRFKISFIGNHLTVKRRKDQILELETDRPMIFYWFTVFPKGKEVIWSANCPPKDIDGEPRNGGWGSWMPWECTVTCGGGDGFTKRKCDNPPPNVFGEECLGSDVFEGPCNDFPCGEISPDTLEEIRKYLSTGHSSVTAANGDQVTLSCDSDLVQRVMNESSQISITWTMNGFPVNKSRTMIEDDYDLVILSARAEDNGVYFCVANQDPGSVPDKVVLDVSSLIVESATTPSKLVRETTSMNLDCNSLPLAYVYDDLSQRWELNGAVWKNYGITTLQAVSTETVKNISKAHMGVWTCVVVQEDLGFRWVTNWILVQVKPAPSMWSHLMEDTATSVLFKRFKDEKSVKLVVGVSASAFLFLLTCTVLVLRTVL